MSENVVIREGGEGRAFTAAKLQTPMQEGEDTLWLPKHAVKLISKSVSKKGTYSAQKDGAYGYSSFTVNMRSNDPVTGKKQDGKLYTVTVDDGGYLKETMVPYRIGIVNPPARLDYTDGDMIDFTGMVVKAFGADDEVWTDSTHPDGVIPFNELVLPVKIANYSDTEYSRTSDLDTSPVRQPVPASSSAEWFRAPNLGEEETYHISGRAFHIDDGCVVLRSVRTPTVKGAAPFYASSNPNAVVVRWTLGGTIYSKVYTDETRFGLNEQFTHNGKTVYYRASAPLSGRASHEISGGPFVNDGEYLGTWGYAWAQENLAWTLIYGDLSGGNSVPVQWIRPTDGRLLETNFNITVTESSAYGGAEGGGGNTDVGGGAGRND